MNPHNFRSRYGDALVFGGWPGDEFPFGADGATLALAIWLKTAGVAPEGPMPRTGRFFCTVFGFDQHVALGIFNLLPVPPLDGSTVLGNFVPAYRRWMDSLGNPTCFCFSFCSCVLMECPVSNIIPFGIANAVRDARLYVMLFGPDVASGYLQLLKFIF